MTRAPLIALFVLVPASAWAQAVAPKPDGAVRFATFNASLNRAKSGGLIRDLSTPDDPQAANVAEIIQRVRPDVLLINEFDDDKEGDRDKLTNARVSKAAELFQKNYLGVAHNGAEPIVYPHRYTPPVNTGVSSGVDLDNDGNVVTTPGARGYGNDALGFGQFPGQYGMTMYSMLPFGEIMLGPLKGTRKTEIYVISFGEFKWYQMPGALVPRKADGSLWYSGEAMKVLPLSSKNHCDVSLMVGFKVVHLLVSHPTPPAFDGPERRNARRNHDEIRLWADYLTGGPPALYFHRGMPPPQLPEPYVIMGDLNADPLDGASIPGAIDQLLKHPKINAANPPRSEGAAEASKKQGQANATHKGDPALDTADFADTNPGNLRVDYVLPTKDLTVLGSGVFWPVEADPLSRLVKMSPAVASSDHRLVYVDIKKP